MNASTPPPTPQSRPASPGLSTAAKLVLFVGLPVLALILIAVTAWVASWVLRGEPVNERFDLEAGSSVEVTVPNAAMDFAPSDDDQVHVTITGTYSGREPEITAATAGGVTAVRGDCGEGWFNRCSLRVTVTLPESVPLTVEGRNGRLTAERLTGPLDFETTNGGIEMRRMTGDLDLRTTNGGIRVDGARSGAVSASTTNGGVELTFDRAPDMVDAGSTNGAITIRVPDDDEPYFITADTTNGQVDTDEVPSDRSADRVITAETTNGNVTVERTRG